MARPSSIASVEMSRIEPKAQVAPSPLGPSSSDDAIWAACLADPALLAHLRGETHRAFTAAYTRAEADWQTVLDRRTLCDTSSTAHLRLSSLEPAGSGVTRNAMVSDIRALLEARQWFADYRGPAMSPADRAALVRPPTAVAAHRLQGGGEHPWDREQRLEIEAANARNDLENAVRTSP